MIRGLNRCRENDVALQINHMLGLVSQVRGTIFHLGNRRFRVGLAHPLVVGNSLVFPRFLSKRRRSSSRRRFLLVMTPSSYIKRMMYARQSSPESRRMMLFIARWLRAWCYRRPPFCQRATFYHDHLNTN